MKQRYDFVWSLIACGGLSDPKLNKTDVFFPKR